MKSLVSLCLLCAVLPCIGQRAFGDEPLAHTYSIVAYDPATGQMGVAVQSHWFSVGSLVIWGEAGTGVVATQSFANPAFGPEGLRLLRSGLDPETALRLMLSQDEGKAFRQVALLDGRGRVAAHTGAKCIEAAGHKIGQNYSVQANLMDNAGVWVAMSHAFETSADQPLAERLVAALEAAQAAGGDIRGQQSAAILVVNAVNTGQPWIDRAVELRVEDHATPVAELKRLLQVKRAYDYMNQGDIALEKGDIPGATFAYGSAERLLPENLEMKYWHAVALANADQVEAALPLFRFVFERDLHWHTLTSRLTQNGVLSVEPTVLQRILQQRRKIIDTERE